MSANAMRRESPLALVVLVMLAGLVGCTDEKTVYVERPIFTDPPEAAQGFLGYDDAETKLTVCGNCHAGVQAKWKTSVHAGAWEDLQASGHAAAYCENCHTVGPNGSAADGNVGHAGFNDPRYYDVQCESCHGPGLAHVTDPETTQPVPSVKIFAVAAGDTTYYTCAECHTGVHHPFVEEWTQSVHATPNSHATSASCLPCHTAQGALANWAPGTRYAEMNSVATDPQGIVCVVCHDPHGTANSAQLRFPIDTPDETTNLCMKCHNRRANPEPSASMRGPHAPEGLLLVGQAGWFPPGFNPSGEPIIASHGSEGNARFCASCHVATFDVTDANGGFVFHATGHLFTATPCLDENGLPTAEPCEDVDQRDFRGCAISGCHTAVQGAKNAYLTAEARIKNLLDELGPLLSQAGYDPAASTIDAATLTVGSGAWFNYKLASLPGSPTHNPFLIEQLLIASIQAVRATYDLPSPTGVSLQLELQ